MFVKWLRLGIYASLIFVLIKCVGMMVLQNKYYESLALENRLQKMVILAPRGVIEDRKGRVMAKSVYNYYRLIDGEKVYEGSDDFVGTRFEEKGLRYDLKRKYFYGAEAGFVTGYVTKPTEEEMAKNDCGSEITANTSVGRAGVEKSMDCVLRGEDGVRMVEVDAKGEFVRDLGRKEPVSGEKVRLSLDAYWQDKAAKLAQGRKMAIVVSEPKTGKIIALVSSPGYDPNDFSYQVDNAQIKAYLQDETGLPMLNRAVGARYHPGSVFKIAVASGGLEDGIITAESTFLDEGQIKVGDYLYRNWLFTKRGATEGQVNVIKGLQRSNDIFFYKLGEKMGPDMMKKWANDFGMGVKTGIELPGEVAGLIPDETWKIKTKGESWFLGNTYHMAIGQGDIEVTPLQINEETRIIANNGVRCKSSLLQDKTPECASIGLRPEVVATVLEGMKRACKPGGTAWPLFEFKTSIACKTGTAQVGDGSNDTHAWLTAFAPAENPQIVITVLVERGGEGSDVAGPVVGDFLKQYFGETNTKVYRYDPTGKVVSE